MIIHLKENIDKVSANNIAKEVSGRLIFDEKKFIIITSSKNKEVPEKIREKIDESFIIDSDIQLSSRKYINKTRKIKINKIELGGSTKNTLMITGPCSIESKDQIEKLREVVEMPLLHPEKFVNLGIDPPKRVLLYGPPGTGKTLMAPSIEEIFSSNA